MSRELQFNYLTTIYSLFQTNGTAKRFNNALFTGLEHHVVKHELLRDMFVHAIIKPYNIKVLWSATKSTYTFVLCRRTPGLPLHSESMNMSDGSSAATAPQTKHAKMRLKFAALSSETVIYARKSQARYKRIYDRPVRKAPAFNPNNSIFIKNSPTRSNVASNAAANLKTFTNRLQPQTVGFFKIITAQGKTLLIDEHGKPQIVLNDHVTNTLERIGTNLRHSNEQLQNLIP